MPQTFWAKQFKKALSTVYLDASCANGSLRTLGLPQTQRSWSRNKNDAEGTPLERQAAEKCSAGILAGFLEYTRKCAERLRGLLSSSKAWWAKSRQLLDMKPKTSNIPALKSDSGNWVFDSKEKPNSFSKTFTAKYTLIPAAQNRYTDIIQNKHVQLKEPVPPEDAVAKMLQ